MLYTNIVGDNLLVGAKNILYKLNAQELRLTQTLRWSSLEPEIDNCLVKGKTLVECQNYIKVLQQYKVSISLQCKFLFQVNYISFMWLFMLIHDNSILE